ncbi:MAG TPA: indole-3-glycerol phosphate synthase TrpC [Terriglobia bacterium]|nr:indole-3-glycerol phosphate synthase TrpC [Terriglobia bacterium]
MENSQVLRTLIAARRRRIEEVRASTSLESLRQVAEARSERRDFAGAISGRLLSVIAELKRASPSRGLLRPEYRPLEIAESYQQAGASALSVLTEEQFFQGSLSDLTAVREAVRLPVLRKDFIVDEYQVYESVAAGADALLLIVAALEDKDLKRFIELSERLHVAALVEVHTAEELERAAHAGARIIGINNRNLNTLEVSLEASFRLREKIPPSCLAVSESGIKSGNDVERLARAGFNAVLIGEHLMLADDPGKELSRLLKSAPTLKMAGA